MFKNDQCSHCFARKKDNGVTCPQYVQNIRTLCSLPAPSGNVHYIFLIRFLMVLSKQRETEEAAAAAGCGAQATAGFWRIRTVHGRGRQPGGSLSSFLAPARPRLLRDLRPPLCRPRPRPSSADEVNLSVCFPLGGSCFALSF